MTRQLFVLVLPLLTILCSADKCSDCLASGKHWCETLKKCGVSPCLTAITKALNCPELPDKAHAYDDNFIRTKVFITHAAAYNMDPQTCFNKQLPSMRVSQIVNINCDPVGPKANCFSFIAVDTTQKAIVLAFRGTIGNIQLAEELLDFFRAKKQFFDAGHVFEYFYDAFLIQWNAGLQSDLRKLKYQYPGFELWVTGHSLGGAMASIAASYIVKVGLYDGTQIKLVTLGQPRTGDYDYGMIRRFLIHSELFIIAILLLTFLHKKVPTSISIIALKFGTTTI
ncbi:unnamed protein product [Caenorhabditis bovis]|uniref:Fungal lipase-type domain-containing protein n=1 Tax=Caenorhabditis bovis TaxID=2654633 RepID=A0A8S1EKU3_9PELO|nr:unnamed protein product [Caenorhabditis bovis]